MIPTNDLMTTIGQMKRLGRNLVPYSFPKKSPADEEDITVLKQREVVVDGVPLIVYYSVSDYGEHKIETVQVLGAHATFVPFYLVCKVAAMFLGHDNLNLAELIHYRERVDEDSRKVYVWNVYRDPNDAAIPPPNLAGRPCIFEGLKYSVLGSDQVEMF